MLDYVLVLPHYVYGHGGLMATVQLAEEFQRQGCAVALRFQKKSDHLDWLKATCKVPISVGWCDATFPACKVAITYSDTPNIATLKSLPQVGHVAINMLSYGMAIERERANVSTPGITILSPSRRTAALIEAEGFGPVHVKSHGHDWENFYPEPGIERERAAAVLFHYAPDKRYELAVRIVNRLQESGYIDGTYIFGNPLGYRHGKTPIPKVVKRFYWTARRSEIREMFSRASVFIMPSVTEGFNLTPAEATLCGCPAILCDGDIGGLFVDEETCCIVERDNEKEMVGAAQYLLSCPTVAQAFRDKIAGIVKNYTWEKAVRFIRGVLGCATLIFGDGFDTSFLGEL